jgi:hypothetical protein
MCIAPQPWELKLQELEQLTPRRPSDVSSAPWKLRETPAMHSEREGYRDAVVTRQLAEAARLRDNPTGKTVVLCTALLL